MKSINWDGKKIVPSKIVCIGQNYVEHIRELGNEIPTEPVFFIKPNSAISSDIYHNKRDLIHFEGEITFVINSGKLAGVGFGLDLTKRQVQSSLRARGLPWERSKSFDRSAVFSDFVSFGGDIGALRLELHINGDVAQHGGCDLMLNKPHEILGEARSFLTFEDGDLLMTGTPKGVGPVRHGDEFAGKIFARNRLIVECSWKVK